MPTGFERFEWHAEFWGGESGVFNVQQTFGFVSGIGESAQKRI